MSEHSDTIAESTTDIHLDDINTQFHIPLRPLWASSSSKRSLRQPHVSDSKRYRDLRNHYQPQLQRLIPDNLIPVTQEDIAPEGESDKRLSMVFTCDNNIADQLETLLRDPNVSEDFEGDSRLPGFVVYLAEEELRDASESLYTIAAYKAQRAARSSSYFGPDEDPGQTLSLRNVSRQSQRVTFNPLQVTDPKRTYRINTCTQTKIHSKGACTTGGRR